MENEAVADSIRRERGILRGYLEEYTKQINSLSGLWYGEDYFAARDALLSAGDEIREIMGIPDDGQCENAEAPLENETDSGDLFGNIII